MWTGIAAIFFFGFGVQDLKEQEDRKNWEKYETKIIDTIVKAQYAPEGSYMESLYLVLEIKINGKVKRYTKYKTQGKSAKRIADKYYKKGSYINIFVNPSSHEKILYELHHSYGPYLVGFLPAFLFFLIALSTLKNTRA